jgi:hypothetical protein
MSELEAKSVVERSGVLVTGEVKGEVVALDLQNGCCYGMNRTASRIWQMLDGPKTVELICTALVADFEVDSETCERDVISLLEELRAEGLVSVRAPAMKTS